MNATDPGITPSGHTPEGGVLVGTAQATRSMVLFEDPQCPYCRQFEEMNGPAVTAALGAGDLAVEYRMRCFLGPESVRADNALALAAEAGRFDHSARRSLRSSHRREPEASRRRTSCVSALKSGSRNPTSSPVCRRPATRSG